MNPRFSILTTVFNTNPLFLKEAAQSVFSQHCTDYEWIILDNGSTGAPVKKELGAIEEDQSVRLFRVEQNLGIMGGMSLCASKATGDYLVPMDSDDLLAPTALATVADSIQLNKEPAFLFSDEDILIDGRYKHPFRRPGWDPVLNLCTSYIWHLCAFKRVIAKQLGVYTDNQSQWCHDWETLFRFVNAGHTPLHIPHVLYHWRRHKESSTNKSDPAAHSLTSQKHLLSLQLERLGADKLFEVDIFPINRGAVEPWLRRKKQNAQPFHLLLEADSMDSGIEKLEFIREATDYPFTSATIFGYYQDESISRDAKPGVIKYIPQLQMLQGSDQINEGLVALVCKEIFPDGMLWPWEAIGMKQLHPDAALFSCRIIDEMRVVVGGGEIADNSGKLLKPYWGLGEADGGNFAMALKQHSVGGVSPGFFIAESVILKKAIGLAKRQISPLTLAESLRKIALKENRRIIFSPLITGLQTDRP